MLRLITAREQLELCSPWRVAAPRHFTTDYQNIGTDYFPTDVISHYTMRKGTGFGDEKAPLYELNNKPPLSQQVTEGGYEKPVELYTDGKAGYIGDGHHRIDVARQLGHSHVPVQVFWRKPTPGMPVSDNTIEHWLKGWLTDMRGGRQTASVKEAMKSIQPNMKVPRQVNKFNQRAEEARAQGNTALADYLDFLREKMLKGVKEGQPQPFSQFYPLAEEEFDL